MKKRTSDHRSAPFPAFPSRRGPFRLSYWLLLVGLFLMRLTVPNPESTRAQAAALGTNHSTLPATTGNLQNVCE